MAMHPTYHFEALIQFFNEPVGVTKLLENGLITLIITEITTITPLVFSGLALHHGVLVSTVTTPICPTAQSALSYVPALPTVS